MAPDDGEWVIRQCITLRNGTRLCKPKGQAFRFRPTTPRPPKRDDE